MTYLERAIKAEICELVPDMRPDIRFLPYIQLHEYEGLLFSDPPAFAAAINEPHLTQAFQQVRDAFPTPKRVVQSCRSYSKVLHGTIAARGIGIEAMRRECPHFRD